MRSLLMLLVLIVVAGCLLLDACAPRYSIDSSIPIQLDTYLEISEGAELDRARQAMEEYWERVCRPLLKPMKANSADPYTVGWNEHLFALKPIKVDAPICVLYGFTQQELVQQAKGGADAAISLAKADAEFASTAARFSQVEDQVMKSSAFRLQAAPVSPKGPDAASH